MNEHLPQGQAGVDQQSRWQAQAQAARIGHGQCEQGAEQIAQVVPGRQLGAFGQVEQTVIEQQG